MPPGRGANGSRQEAAVAPPPEVAAALRRLGFEPVDARLVSPLGASKGRRCAWRVEDASGAVAKVRLFEDPDAAARVCRLRQGREPAFSAVSGRDGAVVLEEWVDGRPLSAAEASDALPWAAALLARLHAVSPPTGEAAMVDASPWRDGARADLERFASDGLLPRTEADRAARLLACLAPGRTRAVVAHLDLCPENLVVDRRGDLHVVDNEMLAVRPPGLDLARSFHLWPMDEPAWRRFLEAYRVAGGSADDLDFWRLVALALGGRIFLERSPARRDDAIRSLLALSRRLEAPSDRAAHPSAGA